MKKHLPLLFLFLFTILGFVVRFYQLGKAPAGLYLDEAAQGYNAYSILKTGKDEFGKAFPVVFRSFGDFKTPVYIYLIVPLIPIFGLTPLTVRLPSFVFSILTLPLIYLLIRRLLPRVKVAVPLGLISVLLLAISPWHTLFGRTNFECNVALFFLLLAVYLFYTALRKPPLLILSAFFFTIALPAYHSQRILVPLVLLLLFIRHRVTLLSRSHRRYLIIGFILGFLISLPTLTIMTTSGFLARATTLNIFTGGNPSGYLKWYTGPLSYLINASWYLTVKEFFALYFSYFSPRNLFLLGDYGPRSSFPDLATFFSWQLPFYIYGLYRLAKEKQLGELRFFTLTLMLIAPIPAALTRDPFSTIRSLPLVVPLCIIIALGLIRCFETIKPGIYRSLAVVGFVLVVIYSLLNLYSSVIVLNERFRSVYWDYGWQQVVNRLNILDQKLPVIIDNVRAEPYSQILFFTAFDPQTYQRDNFEVPLDQYYTNLERNKNKIIGRIAVRPIEWKPDLAKEQYLVADYLGISLEQVEKNHLTLIDQINYSDGTPAYRIVKTNPGYNRK